MQAAIAFGIFDPGGGAGCRSATAGAFHHVDATTKDASVADALGRGWGRARIERELAKCIVLCANCHAKLHARAAEESPS